MFCCRSLSIICILFAFVLACLFRLRFWCVLFTLCNVCLFCNMFCIIFVCLSQPLPISGYFLLPLKHQLFASTWKFALKWLKSLFFYTISLVVWTFVVVVVNSLYLVVWLWLIENSWLSHRHSFVFLSLQSQ